jgi:hypothetical protein
MKRKVDVREDLVLCAHKALHLDKTNAWTEMYRGHENLDIISRVIKDDLINRLNIRTATLHFFP